MGGRTWGTTSPTATATATASTSCRSRATPPRASKTCNVEELAATTTQRTGVARFVAPRAGSAHQHSPLALGRWAPGGRKISPVESHSLLRGDDVLFPQSILERIRVAESLVRLGARSFS